MTFTKGAFALAAACSISPSCLEAADLGPPVAASGYVVDVSRPALRWAGLYAGISAAYAEGRSDYYLAQADHGAAYNNPTGFAGAVTLGYNWQTPGGLVYGIEGDLGYMDLSKEAHWWDDHLYKTRFGPFWGTARGRIGYAMGSFLPYVTGGIAAVQTDETVLGAGEGMANPGQTSPNENFHWGWALGAGVEMAISEKTSLKLEYLRMDFSQFKDLNGNRSVYTFNDSVDLVRVGVNMRF